LTPAFPIYTPWNPSAIIARRLARELIPWRLPNLTFRAFISAETWLSPAVNICGKFWNEQNPYSRFIVGLAFLFLKLLALEHDPRKVLN
jgi:hypothetical protein